MSSKMCSCSCLLLLCFLFPIILSASSLSQSSESLRATYDEIASSAHQFRPQRQYLNNGILSFNIGLLIATTYNFGPSPYAELGVAAEMALNDVNRFLAANSLNATDRPAALAAARALAPLDLSYLNTPFRMGYFLNNTDVSAAIAMLSAYDQYTRNGVNGLVGPTTSTVCEAVELVARIFQAPDVSFSCTASDLSNRNNFPTFFRSVPSDQLQGNAIAMIVDSFHWKNVAVISTNDVYGLGVSSQFQTAATTLGINILSAVVFAYQSSFAAADAAVAQVQLSDARIIIVCGTGQDVFNVFSSALARDILGPQHVWIGPDGVADINLFQGNITLMQAARGLLATAPSNGLGLPQYNAFQSLWQQQQTSNFPDLMPYLPANVFSRNSASYAPQAYDAVLMYAVAANNALGQQIAKGVPMAKWALTAPVLMQAMQNVNFSFTGVSGDLRFSNQDRVSDYILYNLNPMGTAFVALGQASATAHLDSNVTLNVQFFDGTNTPPLDAPLPPPLVEAQTSFGAVVAMNVLMAIEAAWVLFCLLFTVWYSSKPVIKASSPEFLLVICAGLLLALAAVPLLSINSDNLCRAYPFVIGVAYVSIFAALFVKTYRVAYIFNRTKLKVVGHQAKTTRLLLYVGLAVLVELAVNSVWVALNPDKLQHSGDGNANEFFIGCGGGQNYSYWLIASYAYKCAALAWGVLLAMRVRRVHSYFNESKYVITCIFILAFTAIIVPAAFYTSNNPTTRFVLECLWILVLCGYIPVALFVPKVYTILYEPDATGVAENVSLATSATNGTTSIQGPRGPALIPFDQIVAPGVEIRSETAIELRALIDSLNQALDQNDMNSAQHTFYKGVKAIGLISGHGGAAHHPGSSIKAKPPSTQNTGQFAFSDRDREKQTLSPPSGSAFINPHLYEKGGSLTALPVNGGAAAGLLKILNPNPPGPSTPGTMSTGLDTRLSTHGSDTSEEKAEKSLIDSTNTCGQPTDRTDRDSVGNDADAHAPNFMAHSGSQLHAGGANLAFQTSPTGSRNNHGSMALQIAAEGERAHGSNRM